MAKLILKGEERQPRSLGATDDTAGSLYVLVEATVAKIMELDKDSTLCTDLYWSDKHKGYYISTFVKAKSKKA